MVGAELLRAARQAAGLTQAELARRSSTSQSAVAAYESGAKVPSVETMNRLLGAAGRTLASAPTRPDIGRPVSLRRLLRSHRRGIIALARVHHATNVRVFGSVARGDEHARSDVDLLVDMDATASILDHVRLRRALASLLGVEVDVLTSNGLRDRDLAVLEEAIPL